MDTSIESSQQQQHDDDDDDDGRQASVVDKNSTSKNPGDNRGGDSTVKRLSVNLCIDVYFPRRYIVVLLLFVGLCFVHAQRVNIGVAVVSIVDSRHRILEVDEDKTSNTSMIVSVKDSVRLANTNNSNNNDDDSERILV